jgi:REP element-mobilizing transposase RayT
MKYNPDIHHRRSIRLKGYDYSKAGLYFITIRTQNGLCLFGKIINNEMILNDAGRMIKRQWQDLIRHFKNIKLHDFIIMPNHFHGIIEFDNSGDSVYYVGAPLVGAQKLTPSQKNGLGEKTMPEKTPNTTLHPNTSAHVRAPLVGAPKLPPSQNIGRGEITMPETSLQPQMAGQTDISGQPQGCAPTDDGINTLQPQINDQTHINDGQNTSPQPKQKIMTLGDVVGAFKSLTTNEYIRNVKQNNWQPFNKKLWQRNYYEHIIRNEKSFYNISKYIQTNPSQWKNGKYHK